MKRLGFIGLGAMGPPMARNLAASSFDLAVFDIADPGSSLAEEAGRASRLGRRSGGGCRRARGLGRRRRTGDEALFGTANGRRAALEGVVVILSTVGTRPSPRSRGGPAAARRPGLGRPRACRAGDLLMWPAPPPSCSRPSPGAGRRRLDRRDCGGTARATARPSRPSTSCSAASTSPRRPRPSPSPTRWGWTRPRSTHDPHGAAGFVHALQPRPAHPRGRGRRAALPAWTSSSRTWASSSRRAPACARTPLAEAARALTRGEIPRAWGARTTRA